MSVRYAVSRSLLPSSARAIEEGCTFAPKHRNVGLDKRPDDRVIPHRVLVRQLIAEVDDPSRMGNGVESFRCPTRERHDRLPDDDELTFDGRADESVGLIRHEIEPADAIAIASQAATISAR